MEREYFIVINGKQEGPFTIKSLQFKNLNKETLVWFDGLSEWVKAGELQELSSVVKATPPPVGNMMQNNNNPPNIPHVNHSHNNQNYQTQGENRVFGYEIASKSQRFLAYVLITAIWLLINKIMGEEKQDLSALASMTPGEKLILFFVSYIIASFIAAIINGILGAILYPIYSGNIGHKLLGMKVIDNYGNDKKSAGIGFIREFIKTFVGAFVFPLFFIFFSDKNQNFYDKMLGCFVVKTK